MTKRPEHLKEVKLEGEGSEALRELSEIVKMQDDPREQINFAKQRQKALTIWMHKWVSVLNASYDISNKDMAAFDDPKPLVLEARDRLCRQMALQATQSGFCTVTQNDNVPHRRLEVRAGLVLIRQIPRELPAGMKKS